MWFILHASGDDLFVVSWLDVDSCSTLTDSAWYPTAIRTGPRYNAVTYGRQNTHTHTHTHTDTHTSQLMSQSDYGKVYMLTKVWILSIACLHSNEHPPTGYNIRNGVQRGNRPISLTRLDVHGLWHQSYLYWSSSIGDNATPHYGMPASHRGLIRVSSSNYLLHTFNIKASTFSGVKPSYHRHIIWWYVNATGLWQYHDHENDRLDVIRTWHPIKNRYDVTRCED